MTLKRRKNKVKEDGYMWKQPPSRAWRLGLDLPHETEGAAAKLEGRALGVCAMTTGDVLAHLP